MLKALFNRRWFLVGCLISLAGCTIQQTETPALSGPSEFARGLQMFASPDSIAQDGVSTSTITLSAFDDNGRPRGSATYRLDILVGGQPADYGTLSSKTVVTGSNGIATVTYTAPPALPFGSDTPTCRGLSGQCIEIAARAIENDNQGTHNQYVDLRLYPLGVILPPGGNPSASFVFSPNQPTANSAVAFDASASCNDTTATCSSAGLTFAWDFGDGRTGSGKTVSHSFTAAGTYNVTLAVTNDRGRTASTTKQVTVAGGAAPTASFVFSPTPVVILRETFFDASASRAGTGHRIVNYKWNWGDGYGSPDRSTPLEDHDWDIPGTYVVLLTVTDEAGQIGTTSQNITVVSGTPRADFNVTSTGGHGAAFNGTISTVVGSSTTITDYFWNFGDGTTGTGSAPTHTYAASGVFNVTLTVTDSNGRTSTVTKAVTVP